MPSQTSYATVAANVNTPNFTSPAPVTPTTAWTTPEGARVQSDGQTATVSLPATTSSQWLKLTGYNFNVPTDATITGIIASARAGMVGGNLFLTLNDAGVKLVKGGTIGGTDKRLGGWGMIGSGSIFPVRTYGSSTDLWGNTLTPADVNGSTFGIALGIYSDAFGEGGAVDSIALTVYYTAQATTGESDVALNSMVSQPSQSVVLLSHTDYNPERDVELLSQIGFGISVSSPAGGCPTITSAELTVAWSLTSGTQVAYRVQVFTDAAGTEQLYDSGLVGTTLTQHLIPAGVLTSPDTLYLRITVTDSGGVSITSSLICFQTSFNTSGNVSGIDVEAIGGCDAADVLPGIRVRWSRVTAGGGETFSEYEVRRRVVGANLWSPVAVVTDQDTIGYADYNVQGGQRYEYSVAFRAVSGASTLQSADAASPAIGWVDFEHNWLHTANLQSDDGDFTSVRLDAFAATDKVEQETKFVQPWGRDLPSVYVSQAFGHQIDLPLLPDVLNDGTRWVNLQALARLQRDRSAIMCLRMGRSGTLYYVTLADLVRSHAQKTWTATLKMIETYWEDAP